jgi:EmrB/QacA subfamily drug resistance transporter
VARHKAILWIVLIAQFMVILDVALPTISTGLGFKNQLDLQWVINAYILLFGGFLLFGGRAGDLFGRQRLFVIGLVVFGLSSLVSGLAQSPETLIISRATQGLGGALTSPAVLSIIIVTFEGVHERTKALGAFSAVTASGGAVGMLAGGVLTEWLNWRFVFLVNVPIALFAIIAAIKFVPNSRHRIEGQKNRVDLPGAITITAGLMLLVYGIVNAETWGWGSGKVWACLAGAVVLIAAFLAIEAKSRQPLVRLGVFASRTLSVSNLSMFLMRSALFVTLFFPTLYLGEVKHYSPIEIGLAYLPWPVGMFVFGRIAQKIIPKLGPKATLWPGLLIEAIGLFTMGFARQDTSYAVGVLPGLILTSAGAGLAWAALFLTASVGVKREESGLASGLINTSQQLGGAVGLAVISTIAAAYTSDLVRGGGIGANEALSRGFDRGYIVAAIVMLGAAVTAAIGLRSSDGRHVPVPAKQEQSEEVPVISLEPVLGD